MPSVWQYRPEYRGRRQVAPDVIRDELTKLRAAGKLEASYIVDVAADPAHPLHPELTWDDTKAAHMQRLNEARALTDAVYEVEIQPKSKGGGFTIVQILEEHPFTHVGHDNPSKEGHYVITKELTGMPAAWLKSVREFGRNLLGNGRRILDLRADAPPKYANNPVAQAAIDDIQKGLDLVKSGIDRLEAI